MHVDCPHSQVVPLLKKHNFVQSCRTGVTDVQCKNLLENHIDALNSLVLDRHLILIQHYGDLKRNVRLKHKTKQHQIREHNISILHKDTK